MLKHITTWAWNRWPAQMNVLGIMLFAAPRALWDGMRRKA